MRTVANALALVALTSAALAEAPAPEACILTDGDATLLSDLPVDLGSGFVAQSFAEGAREDLPVPFVTISECESGFLIVATRPEANGVRAEAEAVIDVMRTALASDDAETGEDILERLLEIGSIGQLRESPRQTCGCAAFYPEAIGDKTPWEPAG